NPTPPASPGDTLIVPLSGTSNPTLNQTSSASGISGTWTFGNRQTITFDTMETLNPTDLGVTKSGPATATAGNQLTYTISVTNNGPNDAQSVSLTDTLPAGETFFSQSQLTGPGFALNQSGNGISDSISTLVAGASATFRLVATVNANVPNNTIIGNTVSASSSTSDPTPNNNSTTFTTTINTSADLGVSKTGPASAFAGNQITYTLSLTNNGPSDSQGVSLSDILPATETFVSQQQTAGPSFTLNRTGNTITDTIATLAAGASATIAVVVTINSNVPNNTTVGNTGSITRTGTNDPTGATNSSTTNTLVTTSADLA